MMPKTSIRLAPVLRAAGRAFPAAAACLAQLSWGASLSGLAPNAAGIAIAPPAIEASVASGAVSASVTVANGGSAELRITPRAHGTALPASGKAKVLILADGPAYPAALVDPLLASPDVGSVAVRDADAEPPALADLQAYGIVVIASDSPWLQAGGEGTLAGYAQAGGKVLFLGPASPAAIREAVDSLATVAWLSIEGEGRPIALAPGASAEVPIALDAARLADGAYAGTLSFAYAGPASEDTIVIPVSFTVQRARAAAVSGAGPLPSGALAEDGVADASAGPAAPGIASTQGTAAFAAQGYPGSSRVLRIGTSALAAADGGRFHLWNVTIGGETRGFAKGSRYSLYLK